MIRVLNHNHFSLKIYQLINQIKDLIHTPQSATFFKTVIVDSFKGDSSIMPINNFLSTAYRFGGSHREVRKSVRTMDLHQQAERSTSKVTENTSLAVFSHVLHHILVLANTRKCIK